MRSAALGRIAAGALLAGLVMVTVTAQQNAAQQNNTVQNPPAPAAGTPTPAAGGGGAQNNCDVSGEWSARSREDTEDRVLLGTNPGDYTGFPLNEAGRQFADHWSASILSLPTQ